MCHEVGVWSNDNRGIVVLLTRTTKHVLDCHGAGSREPDVIDLLVGRRRLAIGIDKGLEWHPRFIQNVE